MSRENCQMQYRLRTLLIFSAVVPALIGFAALAARLARNRPPSSIEIDWHFATEPADFYVECIVDTKSDEVPKQIGTNAYRIDVPDSHIVKLKSAKAFNGKWRKDFAITPNHPQRRQIMSSAGSHAQGGKGPSEEGARHVLNFKLLK
jgi:hypothetical protein